jgi:hypothetical protein
MFKTSKRARLREIRALELAVVSVSRLLVLELARWAFESVDVRGRVRLSRRQQQAVGLGALAAVGLTTAGLVAQRINHGSDDPTATT